MENGKTDSVLMGGLSAGPGPVAPSSGGGRALQPAVVHADASLLVLDKPSGLLCVPGRGEDKQDCLSARAQARWPDARIVHRLDMATSGLVLMARGLQVQRALSRLFEQRRIHKRYVALVAGDPAPALADSPADADGWRTISLPLGADWPNRPLQRVDTETGRPSVTRWRVLAQDTAAGVSRLELEPQTGRSHQLRVHLQALGLPILGDSLYAPQAVRDRMARLALHASALGLVHPVSGEPVRWTSNAPF